MFFCSLVHGNSPRARPIHGKKSKKLSALLQLGKILPRRLIHPGS